MAIPRCCRDTLNWRVGNLNGPLVDGLEIPCRWCDGVWTFTEGQWSHRDALATVVHRMTAGLPTVRAVIEEERRKREAREAKA